MTWNAFHHRGDVLRTVVDEAEPRRDGVLPMELPGVTETFGDALAPGRRPAAALAHPPGRRASSAPSLDQPDDLESAVVAAWRDAAAELAGVRLILDAAARRAGRPATGDALEQAHRKDVVLMAAMAGLANGADPAAVRSRRSGSRSGHASRLGRAA